MGQVGVKYRRVPRRLEGKLPKNLSDREDLYFHKEDQERLNKGIESNNSFLEALKSLHTPGLNELNIPKTLVPWRFKTS